MSVLKKVSNVIKLLRNILRNIGKVGQMPTQKKDSTLPTKSSRVQKFIRGKIQVFKQIRHKNLSRRRHLWFSNEILCLIFYVTQVYSIFWKKIGPFCLFKHVFKRFSPKKLDYLDFLAKPNTRRDAVGVEDNFPKNFFDSDIA